MVQDEQEKWDIVIKPRSGLFRLDLDMDFTFLALSGNIFF